MRWCSSGALMALVTRGARLPVGALLAVLAGACNDESDAGNDPDPGASGADCEGDGELIEVGMEKQSKGGLYNVVLVDASPVPPRVGENRWTVEVTTAAGDPILDEPPADPMMEDVSPVTIDVLMVLHTHDIRKSGVMTSPGVFEFPPFPVTMTGYWEFTVFVEPEGSTDPNARQGAVFGICIAPE